MKSSEYWAKRFKALEERSNAEAQKCAAESMKLLDDAIVQIDKDITYWLKRFADNNEMTLAEAKKAITNKELKELGWDVEEYIRKGYANTYLGDWSTELENASAKYHITRLDAIKFQIQKFCDEAFADIVDSMSKSLSNVYEDVYYRTAFEVQKGMGVGFSFAQVDENKLKMILERPWAVDGANFSQRVWGTYRPKLTNKLQQALTDWCVRGTDPKRLARKLSYESDVAQSACNRLIHTETSQICTRAEMDSYDELGVEKYRILETLDGKTCEICGDMDSKIFNRNDFEVGVTAPPFHPSCRGTTVPEVDDELLKKGRKRAARDENGKTVYIDDMSYNEWKEKFVSNDQFTNLSNNDIIKSGKELYRKNSNLGAFSGLPERMSKKHIRDIANEFNVDISGLKLNIDASEELLKYVITGEAVPEEIGKITFFPNAFRSKEELLRTLVHEKEHVQQFKEFGAEFVQNNMAHFEKLAYEKENLFIEKAKKDGLL
ncbi:MAG: minor capsid protein [Clostridia bacterium]|nr:minor capsid protein [Clostridia bacterium]